MMRYNNVNSLLSQLVLILCYAAFRCQAGEMKHNEIDSSRACACTWTTIADYEGRLQHSHDTRELMKRLLNQDGVDHDKLKTVERVARRLAAALPYGSRGGMKQFDDDAVAAGVQQLARPIRGFYGNPFGLAHRQDYGLSRADIEDAIRRVLREERREEEG